MNRTLRRILIGSGAATCALLASLSLVSCGNNGKSAYEIAVENGYEGTEEEWLESLNGTDGTDGSDASTETTYEMYETLVASGEFSGTYGTFLKTYLGNTYNIDALMNQSLMQNVSIITTWEVQTSGFGPGRSSTTTTESSASGSGVFYQIDTNEGDAYIITAYHMVYDSTSTAEDGIASDIKCYIYGSESDSDQAMEATFIGGDLSEDIAILKIDDSEILKDNDLVESVTFGNADNLFIGESVFAVGNNKGQGLSANEGTLSLLSYDATYSISDYTATVRSFRYDAATNAGNSGGAVYNEYGELIGIVNCKMETTGVEGMQYAVPVSVVEGLAYHVVENYESTNKTTNTKVSLQATYEDDNSVAYINQATGMYNTKADVVVSKLESDGVLENAGLQVGDIIESLEINPDGANNHTKTINHYYEIDEFLYWASKDDTIKITYKRNGELYSVTTTLSYAAEM